MSERKHRLVDCDPRWARDANGVRRVSFDCPEGHEGCRYTVPVADGAPNDVGWGKTGDDFATMSITPSIKGIPSYATREAAIAAGCIEELLHPRMFCALHIFITNGAITFCGDSK